MSDLTLNVTLKAKDGGLTGELRLNREELDRFNESGKKAGEGLKTTGDEAAKAEARLKQLNQSAKDYIAQQRDELKVLDLLATGRKREAESLRENLALQRQLGPAYEQNAQELEDMARQMEAARGRVEAFEQSQRKSSEATGLSATQVKALIGAMVALYSTLRLGQLARSIDEFQSLKDRLRAATDGSLEFQLAYSGVYATAARTGTELEGNIALFQRLKLSAKDIDASTPEMLRFVDTVQKLGVIGGASTMAITAGTMQLGQAISSAVVRAQEFNSLTENIPQVADRIAAGMGMTVSQLRLAVLEGRVLSKDVFEALLSQSEDVAEQFEQMPIRMGRAGEHLSTSMLESLSRFDRITGLTRQFAEAMEAAADAMDRMNAGTLESKRAELSSLERLQANVVRMNPAQIEQMKMLREEINALVAASIEEIEVTTRRNFEHIKGNKQIILDLRGLQEELEAVRKKREEDAKAAKAAADDELRRQISAENQIRTMRDQISVMELLAEGRKDDADLLEIQLKLQRELGSVYPQFADQIEEVAAAYIAAKKSVSDYEDAQRKAAEEAKKQQDELLRQAEATEKQWSTIWTRGAENMVDALANGFRRGISSLRDFFSIVKDLAAQIAAMLVFRPVVGTMLGGLAGLGVPGAAQAAAQGGFDVSGGFSLANLLSPSSALSGLGTWLAKSQVGQALGLSESFNLSGATLLQTTHLGDLFAEGLGSSPWGIVGNMAAKMFGLKGSGNTLVDAGLGFAGSVGGGMVGAATLGTALGSAAGPVGAIIGAALAQGIASLFAGKPSAHTEAAFFDFGLNKRGQSDLGPGKDSPENRQAAETLLDTILDLKGLLEATGGTITSLNYIGVGVGNRAGTPELTLNAFGQVSQFSSAEDLVAAISQQMADNLSGVPARIQQAIDGIDWSNLEAATATLTEAIAAEAAWQQTMQSIRDEIAQMTDPQQYELNRLDKVAADLREGAMGNAEDLAAIEEWFWLKRKEITDRYVVTVEDLTVANDNFAASAHAVQSLITSAFNEQMKAVSEGINSLSNAARNWQRVAEQANDWVFGLRYDPRRGSASSQIAALTPLFDETLEKALGGDLTAAGQLKTIGDKLLEAQEKATGTTGAWHTLAAKIESGYAQLGLKANSEVSLAQAQLDVMNAQLAELRKLSGGAGAGAPAGYGRDDLGSLVSGFNAAQAASGMSTLDFLNSSQGQAWITARNNFVAGLTDPVLLAEQLAEATRQSSLPGWEQIGRDYEAVVRAQGRAQGIAGFKHGTGAGRTGTIARIHNEELLYSGPPIQVFSREQSRHILGAGAGGDSRDLAARLDRIIAQNDGANRVAIQALNEVRELRKQNNDLVKQLANQDRELKEQRLQVRRAG